MGSKVRVFYNPRNPKSATLDTTVDNRVLVILYLAGTTISIFAMAAYGGLFAQKGSLLVSLSTPLLLVAVMFFAATLVIAIRGPGDKLMDENQV